MNIIVLLVVSIFLFVMLGMIYMMLSFRAPAVNTTNLPMTKPLPEQKADFITKSEESPVEPEVPGPTPMKIFSMAQHIATAANTAGHYFKVVTCGDGKIFALPCLDRSGLVNPDAKAFEIDNDWSFADLKV